VEAAAPSPSLWGLSSPVARHSGSSCGMRSACASASRCSDPTTATTASGPAVGVAPPPPAVAAAAAAAAADRKPPRRLPVLAAAAALLLLPAALAASCCVPSQSLMRASTVCSLTGGGKG